MANNIIIEWLRSLRLDQYAESFIDNGYDDLEICKQIGDPDLDAIGVFNASHRSRLLQSVKTLREEGAACVYLTLEESTLTRDDCSSDNISASSSRTGKLIDRSNCSPGFSSGSGQEIHKYHDEYEEGKAELVKIPKLQLKNLLREKLLQDGIHLSCQSYSNSDGERGYLEGLASRYADTFNTHYGDVLEHLEELRRREWDELSPRIRVLGGGGTTPDTPPSPQPTGGPNSQSAGITNSMSQPIYVPGKYSPSSCLSDKEEDEIYGFGYGVYGKQMMQRQQQKNLLMGAQGPQIAQVSQQIPQQVPQQLILQQQPLNNYNTCLSPRSAYFYEFPPNESGGGGSSTTNKKRTTTFSRIFKGLKTSHRKEKHGSSSSPRHGNRGNATLLPPHRVDTPDSVLHIGLGFDAGIHHAQHQVLRSMVDPRDYDRLIGIAQLNHINNGGNIFGNSFEETIYRLKVQEALKKKEKFNREHEEILRDIRQGLLQLGKEGQGMTTPPDDTYMYDEDIMRPTPSTAGPGGPRHGHWYDEPPYESDPEDFLMGSSPQGPRVCFTMNSGNGHEEEPVISLRTAGDISVTSRRRRGMEMCEEEPPRRGLILPQRAGHPPTIIPLTRPRRRQAGSSGQNHRQPRVDSGDYASDVQSVGSRLSTLSVDTARSGERRDESGSSEEDGDRQCHTATVHAQISNEDRGSGTMSGLVGRVRGLRQDVQRKISRLRNDSDQNRSSGQRHGGSNNDQSFTCSVSSIESLPSGSGSSTQALVRAGSNHSSISAEIEIDQQQGGWTPAPGTQIIGRARAIVDQVPSPYDREALKFMKGDIIDIVSMNASGLWRGICNNKLGTFKFINVELLTDRDTSNPRLNFSRRRGGAQRPASVEQLLQNIGMQEHISVFVLNGYEDLELFKEIEPADLDYLGIVNSEHRTKILTAVQLLHDLESSSDIDEEHPSSAEDDPHRRLVHGDEQDDMTSVSFTRGQFPRDSGCYEGERRPHRSHKRQQPSAQVSTMPDDCDNPNNLDSVVQRCNDEILARVRQQQGDKPNSEKSYNVLHMEANSQYTPNIPISEDPSQAKSSCRPSEDTCDLDQKLTIVKYVVGSGNEQGCESGSTLSRGCCMSEKSSDSGVSSSSLSSGPNNRNSRNAIVRGVTSPPLATAAAGYQQH